MQAKKGTTRFRGKNQPTGRADCGIDLPNQEIQVSISQIIRGFGAVLAVIVKQRTSRSAHFIDNLSKFDEKRATNRKKLALRTIQCLKICYFRALS